MGDYIIYSDENLPVESFKKFQEIRHSNRFSDVTLKAHNAQFPVHRIILAAAIPYFDAMFMSEMVESRQDEVSIKGIDPKTLGALLEFAYTGSIRITAANVCRLLSASSYLQLFKVRDACCEFLEKRFQADNILGVRALANQLDCSNLEKAANQFIVKNFVQISQSKEYQSLKLTDLMEIISREELHENTSEEQVFSAVMNWVKRDQGNRKEMVHELLSKIRLHLMSPEFLVGSVGKEPLIRASLECMYLLENAKDFHLMQLNPTTKTRMESQNDDADCIYALHHEPSGYWRSEKYNVKNNKWVKEISMQSSCYGVAVNAIRRKLYVIGVKFVNVFDPKTRTWSTGAPMEIGRWLGCAAVLRNQIYVCGGLIRNNSPSNAVHCYDPESDKWRVVNGMKTARFASCAVSLNDCLYVLGGGNFSYGHGRRNHRGRGGRDSAVPVFVNLGGDYLQPTDLVEMYDPQSGKWSSSTSMLTKRCYFGATALNGKIYVSGGITESYQVSCSVEVYNPITKQWKYIEPMNEARKNFALVPVCGRLYAVGGNDDEDEQLNSVEVYDPEEDMWSFVAHMKQIKGNVMAVEFCSHTA